MSEEQKPGESRPQSTPSISTGGGAYVGGGVTVSGSGSFVGRDQTITNYQGPSQGGDTAAQIDELRRQLAAMQAQLQAAIDAQEIQKAGQARDAQAALAAVEEELGSPEPDGERVVDSLERATTILERSARTADAAGQAGAAVLKLAPLVASALALARGLFGLP